jgi:hypothetical protein
VAGRNEPNSKPVPDRFRNPKIRFGHLKLALGICLGFVIWNLGFEIN